MCVHGSASLDVLIRVSANVRLIQNNNNNPDNPDNLNDDTLALPSASNIARLIFVAATVVEHAVHDCLICM